MRIRFALLLLMIGFLPVGKTVIAIQVQKPVTRAQVETIPVIAKCCVAQ